jgi:hypothetical protein
MFNQLLLDFIEGMSMFCEVDIDFDNIAELLKGQCASCVESFSRNCLCNLTSRQFASDPVENKNDLFFV